MVTWTIFKNPPLGARPNTKLGDYDTLNAHNCCIIIIMCEDPHEEKLIEIAFG